ncbi:cupin domain-containing protein [Dongia sp.]|uniref:cupin domain-containing protein n=1 Tax=Dongia sp. TaxID=1977262 RepID=UPI0035AF0F9F
MNGFPAIVDLLAAAGDLTAYWSPRIVARVNDQYVKVAKLKGSFVWHAHEDEDELFHVLRGTLRIEYRDRPAVELPAGAIHVVPRGVQHNPVATEECWIVLVEPVGTRHTGDTSSPLSKTVAEQLGR